MDLLILITDPAIKWRNNHNRLFTSKWKTFLMSEKWIKRKMKLQTNAETLKPKLWNY